MKSLILFVLFLSVSAAELFKTTHAEFVGSEVKNNSTNKENKTVIELNKDITVNTGLNLDETLAQLNGTKDSNKPKIRKVTHVDNYSLERKLKTNVNATEVVSTNATTTTAPLLKLTEIITEAGAVALKEPAKNVTGSATIVSNLPNLKNSDKSEVKDDKNNNINTTSMTKKLSDSSTITTIKPNISVAANLTITNITSTIPTPSISSRNNSTSSTPTSTTTTTTTTTSTTTPKPKKPTITYSVPDFPDLEKDNPELKNLLQSSASNKLPIPDGPYAQPSQEFNSNFHRSRDFILPIVSMLFIIPLVIGILITSYRRFRDCWSTRHYRRMDFLVDGMYND